MLRFLPGPAKGCLSLVLIFFNTSFFCIPLYVTALFRALLPASYEPACTRFSMATAENWISVNNIIIDTFQNLTVTVTGEPELSRDRWYLVICNHQSWTDILILQRILNRKIPLLKFFIFSGIRTHLFQMLFPVSIPSIYSSSFVTGFANGHCISWVV